MRFEAQQGIHGLLGAGACRSRAADMHNADDGNGHRQQRCLATLDAAASWRTHGDKRYPESREQRVSQIDRRVLRHADSRQQQQRDDEWTVLTNPPPATRIGRQRVNGQLLAQGFLPPGGTVNGNIAPAFFSCSCHWFISVLDCSA